jgi:hypothetical protein
MGKHVDQSQLFAKPKSLLRSAQGAIGVPVMDTRMGADTGGVPIDDDGMMHVYRSRAQVIDSSKPAERTHTKLNEIKQLSEVDVKKLPVTYDNQSRPLGC